MKRPSCLKNAWIENSLWVFKMDDVSMFPVLFGYLRENWEDESARAKAARVLTIQFLNCIGLSCYHYFFFHLISSNFKSSCVCSVCVCFSLFDCLLYFHLLKDITSNCCIPLSLAALGLHPLSSSFSSFLSLSVFIQIHRLQKRKHKTPDSVLIVSLTSLLLHLHNPLTESEVIRFLTCAPLSSCTL